MAPQQPPQHPLDVLPAMVNGVLLQTAKIFRDPTRQDPTNLGYTNTQMKSIITGFQARMHSALDELEVEILRAKATIDRDLLETRAQKIESERQAAAEQHRVAEGVQPKEKSEAVIDPSRESGDQTTTEDTVMAEGTEKEDKDVAGRAPEMVSPKPAEATTAKELSPAKAPTPNEPEPSGTSAQAQEAPPASAFTGPEPEAATAVTQPAPANDLPSTTDLPLDLDSMFADTTGTDIDDANAVDFNFDLDDLPTTSGIGDPNAFNPSAVADVFGTDSTNTHAANINTTATGPDGRGDVGLPADLDLDLFGPPDTAPSGNGNGNGDNEEMLPGLRSYANAPEDSDALDLLDLPPTSTSAPALDPSVPGPTTGGFPSDPPQEQDQQGQDLFDASALQDATNFDDLFGPDGTGFDLDAEGITSAGGGSGTGTGTGAGASTGDGDTLGTGNEFDDWMNM